MSPERRKDEAHHRAGVAPAGRHPWRATLRTALIAVVGFIPVFVELVNQINHTFGNMWPLIAQVALITGILTRVMSTPAAEAWIARYMPWLGAENYNKPAPYHTNGERGNDTPAE